MKAGDIKRCLEKVISSERRDNLNPRDFNINDNFLLGVFNSYKNGDPPEHMDSLVDGFIQTEKLTVERRIAVLNMVRDVLTSLSKPDVTPEDRERLRSILTAYFI